MRRAAAFRALDLDLGIVAANGLILPEAILLRRPAAASMSHASLLRAGVAQRRSSGYLAGDRRTGLPHAMERGLDTGPMIAAEPTTIDRKTAGELTAEWPGSARLLETVLQACRIEQAQQDNFWHLRPEIEDGAKSTSPPRPAGGAADTRLKPMPGHGSNMERADQAVRGDRDSSGEPGLCSTAR